MFKTTPIIIALIAALSSNSMGNVQRTVDRLPETTLAQKLKKQLLLWGIEDAAAYEEAGMQDYAEEHYRDIAALARKDFPEPDPNTLAELLIPMQEPDPDRNPALARIYQSVEKAMREDERFPKGQFTPRLNNGWYYTRQAETLHLLAWAFCHPQSEYYLDPELFPIVMRRLSQSLEFWYNDSEQRIIVGEKDLGTSSGLDSEQDFKETASALLYMMLTVPDYFLPAEKERWLTGVRRKTEIPMRSHVVQADNFIRQTPEVYSSKVFRIPNKNYNWMVGLAISSLLLDDEELMEGALTILEMLNLSIYEDGGMPYINYENECPSYHGIHVVGNLWMHRLTGEPRAMENLEKLRRFYPTHVEPSGELEYFTDTFAKHYFSGPGVAKTGSTILAQLFSCPQNQRIAEVSGGADSVNTPMFAEIYRPGVEAAAGQDQFVFYDRNIQGPRGRFGDWSFAGTGRIYDPDRKLRRGKDTLVGAMISDDPSERRGRPLNAAIAAVNIGVLKPEEDRVGKLREFNYYMLSTREQNTDIVGPNFASFSSHFIPKGSKSNWRHTLSEYRTNQLFLMLPDRLVGFVSLDASEEEPSGEVSGEIRLYDGRNRHRTEVGKRHDLEKNGEDSFIFGRMQIQLVEHNFEEVVVEPTFLTQYGADDAAESVFLEHSGDGQEQFYFVFEGFDHTSSEPSEIAVKEDGPLRMLAVKAGETQYMVLQNTSDSTVSVPVFEIKRGQTRHLYRGTGLESSREEIDRSVDEVSVEPFSHIVMVDGPDLGEAEPYRIMVGADLVEDPS
ncbi:MAG: hypothetical protein AAGJ81_09270 [Verrucomicrobiota bacterium]